MAELQRLRVQGLRNLSQVSITPVPGVNVFFGRNGSGKTSLLEAIHVLGLGRSFRTRQTAPIVQQGSSQVLVYGRLSAAGDGYHDLGISKSRRGETQLRHNGANVSSIAEFARLLPLVLVVPETFDLLVGGPAERRQYLDWGVFHVEHSYIDIWRNYQRCLKQRNTLLRHGRIDRSQIAIWDGYLSQYADEIDRLRRRYLKALEPHMRRMLSAFGMDSSSTRIDYLRGWPNNQSLAELLRDHLERDHQLGRTSHGPHRCDLRLTLFGLDAKDHLSRGQQKVVISAMKLAQGLCLVELAGGTKSIYLIDDLHAELDQDNARIFSELLAQLDTQVFITALSHEVVTKNWSSNVPLKMFHVEHGAISEFST